MIDLTAIYDLIAQVFHHTQEDFSWGDNAIIHGSVADLPAPDVLSGTFVDGDYFALIDIHDVIPESAGNSSLREVNYEYSIILMRKGKGNIDLTKIRNDMVNKFADGWHKFFAQLSQHREEITNIALAVPELEKDLPLIAVRFDGVITAITQTSIRRGSIND